MFPARRGESASCETRRETMARYTLFVVATFVAASAAALQLPVVQTRREALISAASATVFLSADAAGAYGIQARPARDFSGVPVADSSFVDPAIEAAERAKEAAEKARSESSTSAKFGSASTEPPKNKAQEKLAKAKAEAQARAQRR